MKNINLAYCKTLIKYKLECPKNFSDLAHVCSDYSQTDFIIWTNKSSKNDKNIAFAISLNGHLFLDSNYFDVKNVLITEEGFIAPILKRVYDPNYKKYIDPEITNYEFKIPFIKEFSQIRSEYKYVYKLNNIANYTLDITSTTPDILNDFIRHHQSPTQINDRQNACWFYESFIHYLVLHEFSGLKLLQILNKKVMKTKEDWENAKILGFLGYFDKECKFYPSSGFNKYDGITYPDTKENLILAYKKALTSVIFYDYNSESGLQSIAYKMGTSYGLTDLNECVDILAFEIAKAIYQASNSFKLINHFHAVSFLTSMKEKRPLNDVEVYLQVEGLNVLNYAAQILLNNSKLFKAYYGNMHNALMNIQNLLFAISMRSYKEFIILYDFEISQDLKIGNLIRSIYDFQSSVIYEQGITMYMNQCILDRRRDLPIFTDFQTQLRYFPIIKLLSYKTLTDFLNDLKNNNLLENNISSKNKLVYHLIELYKCFKKDSEYQSPSSKKPLLFTHVTYNAQKWSKISNDGVYVMSNLNKLDLEKGLRIELNYKEHYLPLNYKSIKIEKYPNLKLTNMCINKKYLTILYSLLNNNLLCRLNIS